MGFVAEEIVSSLANLTKEEVDDFNHGAIKLDKNGNILIYNKRESEIAGVPVENAVGKNFFTEVAPCTNNKLFFGKFQKGIENGELNESFNFTFTYKMTPTSVGIHMVKTSNDDATWVFIEIKS